MSRARHILAVVAVTTALCANHLVSAATSPRPRVTEIAARWVGRISRTFRRTAPNAVRESARIPFASQAAPVCFAVVQSDVTRHREFSPFQFRLPPPAFI